MPDRRKGEKGSFGSDLDELVQKFPHRLPKDRTKRDEQGRRGDGRHINDLLFESAWRKERDV